MVGAQSGDPRSLANVELQIREFPFAGAHFRDGDVAAAGRCPIPGVLTPGRRGVVEVGVLAVKVEPPGVQMCSAQIADVAVRVHMDMETADLHREHARPCAQENGDSRYAHRRHHIMPAPALNCGRQGAIVPWRVDGAPGPTRLVLQLGYRPAGNLQVMEWPLTALFNVHRVAASAGGAKVFRQFQRGMHLDTPRPFVRA